MLRGCSLSRECQPLRRVPAAGPTPPRNGDDGVPGRCRIGRGKAGHPAVAGCGSSRRARPGPFPAPTNSGGYAVRPTPNEGISGAQGSLAAEARSSESRATTDVSPAAGLGTWRKRGAGAGLEDRRLQNLARGAPLLSKLLWLPATTPAAQEGDGESRPAAATQAAPRSPSSLFRGGGVTIMYPRHWKDEPTDWGADSGCGARARGGRVGPLRGPL
jgi:hypothetical protein